MRNDNAVGFNTMSIESVEKHEVKKPSGSHIVPNN